MLVRDIPYGHRFECNGQTLIRPNPGRVDQSNLMAILCVDAEYKTHLVDVNNAAVDLGPACQPVYSVYAKTIHGPYLLGLASGDILDIEAYFHDRRQYGLEVKPLETVFVRPGFATDRARLWAEKEALEAKLTAVNSALTYQLPPSALRATQ